MTTARPDGPSGDRYDYVAVGHVARDELSDGTHRAGGTAFYSALQAARLGLRALIVTQGSAAELGALLAPWRGEFDLHVTPTQSTTALLTRGSGARRTQRLLSWAGEMTEPPIPGCSILHLAPIARELSKMQEGDDCVITPQGLLRRWPGRAGNISLGELSPERLPNSFFAAVLSEHELGYCAPLLGAARENGACVTVTAAERPPTLWLADGSTLTGPAPLRVHARDDVGAGDVFAAAFFVALREGHDAMSAASLANAAAAIRIGGYGPDAIGTRERIETLAR